MQGKVCIQICVSDHSYIECVPDVYTVCACVCACVRACVRVCVCTHCVHKSVCLNMCNMCVCVLHKYNCLLHPIHFSPNYQTPSSLRCLLPAIPFTTFSTVSHSIPLSPLRYSLPATVISTASHCNLHCHPLCSPLPSTVFSTASRCVSDCCRARERGSYVGTRPSRDFASTQTGCLHARDYKEEA